MWNRIIKTSAALYIPLLIFTLVWENLQKKELITNMGQIQQRNILSKSYNLIDQGMVLIDITSFWSSVTFPASFSDKNQLNPDFLKNYIRTMQGLDVYEQFRLIDLHGNEVVRYEKVNQDSMAPAYLQNKVDRGYFQAGLSLRKGQVYV